MWLDGWVAGYVRDTAPGSADTVAWSASGEDQRGESVLRTPLDLPVVCSTVGDTGVDAVETNAVIPPSVVQSLPDRTLHTLLVSAGPGRDLPDELYALGFAPETHPDYQEYDFVATMRAIIWTIAAVVIGIGLLALMIATVDRVVQRRKEVVALQLVGLGRGVVRRAQLFESAVPLTIGIVLSIGLGALAGATFLTLDETLAMPWAQTWRLGAIAVLGGLLVAGICMLAAAPRLRPEEIRAE